MCNSWFISSLIPQIFLPSLPEDLVFSGFHIYLFPSSWWLESTSNSASLEIGYWLGVHCLYFLSTQRQWSFFLMEGPSAFKAICQLCPFHFSNWFDLRFQVWQVNVSVVSLNFESKMLKKKKKFIDLNLWRRTLNYWWRQLMCRSQQGNLCNRTDPALESWSSVNLPSPELPREVHRWDYLPLPHLNETSPWDDMAVHIWDLLL